MSDEPLQTPPPRPEDFLPREEMHPLAAPAGPGGERTLYQAPPSVPPTGGTRKGLWARLTAAHPTPDGRALYSWQEVVRNPVYGDWTAPASAASGEADAEEANGDTGLPADPVTGAVVWLFPGTANFGGGWDFGCCPPALWSPSGSGSGSGRGSGSGGGSGSGSGSSTCPPFIRPAGAQLFDPASGTLWVSTGGGCWKGFGPSQSCCPGSGSGSGSGSGIVGGAGTISVPCCTNLLPATLHVTFHDTGGCDCVNGLVVPVTWNGSSWTTGGSDYSIGTACGSPAKSVRITLSCQSLLCTPNCTCANFSISITCPGGAVGFSGGTAPDAGCSCNPFALTFSGLQWSNTAGTVPCCTGTFSVGVTP